MGDVLSSRYVLDKNRKNKRDRERDWDAGSERKINRVWGISWVFLTLFSLVQIGSIWFGLFNFNLIKLNWIEFF
jgi:hypothetical protein